MVASHGFPEELPASPDVLITAAVRTADDFQNPENYQSLLSVRREFVKYIYSPHDYIHGHVMVGQNINIQLQFSSLKHIFKFNITE